MSSFILFLKFTCFLPNQKKDTLMPVQKKSAICPNIQSTKEELANALTHGVGLLVAIPGGVFLLTDAASSGSSWKIIACSIYITSLILLLTASTTYHLIPHSLERAKEVSRRIDHISVYFLIAGTYTLVCFTILRGTWGWTLFGIEWGLVLFGGVFKAVFGARYDNVSTAIYLIMGWIVIVAINPLVERTPSSGLWLLFLGGACFSGGIFFYLQDQKKKFYHSIWHVFVLGGCTFHYFFALECIVPF